MPERRARLTQVPGAVRLGRTPRPLWHPAACAAARARLGLAENGLPRFRGLSPVTGKSARTFCSRTVSLFALLLDGRAPRPGEIFQQPDLAATPSAVAEGGADVFDNGEIARSIARAAQEAGGYLSEEDLAEARVHVGGAHLDRLPRGAAPTSPPPGQGVAALEMLNILEGFETADLDPVGAGPHPPEVEAKKLAGSAICTRRLAILSSGATPEVPTGPSVLQGVCSEAARASISPDLASGKGPGAGARRGHDRSVRGGTGGQRVLVHKQPLHGVRQRRA